MATKNFVPRADNEGGIGTSVKRWANAYLALLNGYAPPLVLDNASVAQQTGFAADAYLTGSRIQVTPGAFAIGSRYKCVFDMTKTGAGTATFIISVRVGTNGTIADTAVATITFAVGTAAIDTGKFEVILSFRSVGGGTAAVIECLGMCYHHLAATGLVSTGASGFAMIKVTSGGFDSNVAPYIGLSINGGTSFAGTCELVQTELQL